MSTVLPQNSLPTLPEPLWLPAPENPALPVGEIHLWRFRMEAPRWTGSGDCAVSRDRAMKLNTALFRGDILDRYTGNLPPGLIAGPSAGLRVALAQSDDIALIAVSRNVREVGLDVERVLEDIPIEEMAGGFLDANSQWDLRITWSLQEKAWKFFHFWTSSEACAQAHRPFQSPRACTVRGFSPDGGFIAALAIQGGPEAEVHHWDWVCEAPAE